MKLYTEEQVRKAVMIAENQKIGFTTIMIEHLTPIELPSDDEIEREARDEANKKIILESILRNRTQNEDRKLY